MRTGRPEIISSIFGRAANLLSTAGSSRDRDARQRPKIGADGADHRLSGRNRFAQRATVACAWSGGRASRRCRCAPRSRRSPNAAWCRCAGGSTVIAADLLAGRIADTAKVTLGVSRSAGFDVPSLLLALDRYPLGCAEQTVSRALPLLYLSEVARQARMADDAGVSPRPGCDRAGALLSSSSQRLRPGSPGSGDHCSIPMSRIF